MVLPRLQVLRVLVALVLIALGGMAGAGDLPPATASSIMGGTPTPLRVVTLRHDPYFILQAVAKRMGIAIRPEVPLPKVLLESQTPLSRLQLVAERQWGFRPQAFVSAFASTTNEIYLIDDADEHERRGGTVDDALAHEFAHYLQEAYRKTSRQADWSEYEAVVIQRWFRAQYVGPRLVAVDVRPVR